ncbi:MAG TPA: site-2 protease family protein [Bacillota bacterium]|nr:site-2 protease family protein [Bacillota bacterium]
MIDGLISYLALVVLLTFHEFGHAWMAWRCGDDTARLQGRVSLNPLVHIDLIGTVILPLLMLLVPGAGRFIIGWAKPVPVNPYNLRNPRVDDILVTLAGPWMNLVLAVVCMGLARVGLMLHSANMVDLCLDTAHISLLLCFFNLLPIPPLDGSQVVRALTRMSYETYAQIARFGFLILIIALQLPFITGPLNHVTHRSWVIIGGWFGIPLAA